MTLQELNELDREKLSEELTKCCGASAWVHKMLAAFPFSTKTELLDRSEKIWFSLSDKDWKEAFEHHPKIGGISPIPSGGDLGVGEKFANTVQWASGEQSGVKESSENTLEDLAQGNKEYEDKFGYIFIVCATGKSAEEMWAILRSRLGNDPKDEIKIAAAEQNKITQLRINKLLTD